jgi:cell division protein FtsN
VSAAVDYKNRVPGSRYRRPRRPLNLWTWIGVAAVAAIALIYGLWPAGDGEESVQEAQEPPPATTSQQLPVPPIAPPPNAKDKASGGRDRVEPAEAAKGVQTRHDKKKPEQEAAVAADPVTPPVEPRFTFYKILPEKEVIIPEAEIKAIKRDEGLGHSAKPEQYQIQVGSYSSPAEAEKIKARLSQLKVKSKIESVKIENAQWYRVKIGPFDKLADADKVRDYLKANQLPSVVQKSTGK